MMSALIWNYTRTVGGRLFQLSRESKFVNICLIGSRHKTHVVETDHEHNRSVESQDKQKPDDKPVGYTASKAYKYKAAETFRVTEEQAYPWYIPAIVKLSVSIFLVYFCVLREPNDIDEKMSRGLFETVPDLEIPMLEAEVRRLHNHGIDTTELRAKIEQLKKLSKTG